MEGPAPRGLGRLLSAEGLMLGGPRGSGYADLLRGLYPSVGGTRQHLPSVTNHSSASPSFPPGASEFITLTNRVTAEGPWACVWVKAKHPHRKVGTQHRW